MSIRDTDPNTFDTMKLIRGADSSDYSLEDILKEFGDTKSDEPESSSSVSRATPEMEDVSALKYQTNASPSDIKTESKIKTAPASHPASQQSSVSETKVPEKENKTPLPHSKKEKRVKQKTKKDRIPSPPENTEAEASQNHIIDFRKERTKLKKKLRKESKEQQTFEKTEPEDSISPLETAKKYHSGLRSLKRRTTAAFILSILICYLTISPHFSFLPGPDFAVAVPAILLLQILIIILCFDSFIKGFTVIQKLHITPLTIVSCAIIVTFIDALSIMSSNIDIIPYCALPSTALSFGAFGQFKYRRAMSEMLRFYLSADTPVTVKCEERLHGRKNVLLRTTDSAESFTDTAVAQSGITKIFNAVSPLFLLSSLVLALLAAYTSDTAPGFIRSWAAIISVCVPFSALIAFEFPFSGMISKLARFGATIAGWGGAVKIARRGSMVLSDSDFFTPGLIKIDGIKIFGGYSSATVISYASSVIISSKSALSQEFSKLLQSQHLSMPPIEGITLFENGISASIRGDMVLIGTEEFIRSKGISSPLDIGSKKAVFFAINTELAGIFGLNYTPSGAIASELASLSVCRRVPVMATRDFNITPEFADQKLKFNSPKTDYPTAAERYAMTDVSSDSAPVGLLKNHSLLSFSKLILGSTQLRSAVLTNSFLSAISSFLGMLLMYYFSFIGNFVSGSAANALLFMLLWIVPTFIISKSSLRF